MTMCDFVVGIDWGTINSGDFDFSLLLTGFTGFLEHS